MFASRAGAQLVIGIDMSNILDQAEKIVRANGFTEESKIFPLIQKQSACLYPPTENGSRS